MKTSIVFSATLFALCALWSCQKEVTTPTPTPETIAVSDRNPVVIPAGSVDALAAALQTSNTVVLASGVHTETQSVVVSGSAHIIGQPGAVLHLTSPTAPDYPLSVVPGLHLKNAYGALMQGIAIEPVGAIGGTAILVENSGKTALRNCSISGFQFGVLVEKSPFITIENNVINTTIAWQTGEVPEAHGIVVINGAQTRIERNEVFNALFGIWACDKNGVCNRNVLHDNYLGIILCKVPLGSFQLPDGSLTGAIVSCSGWTASSNNSHDNFTAGYLVIDGANNNYVARNQAANNGTYDYELVGDSERFGFLTPFCFDNTVYVAPGNTVKDCGMNNTVIGGILIDNTIDPCN